MPLSCRRIVVVEAELPAPELPAPELAAEDSKELSSFFRILRAVLEDELWVAVPEGVFAVRSTTFRVPVVLVPLAP